MLKIFVVVMLWSPGAAEPIMQRFEADSYQACVDRADQVRAKAKELNARGGPISEFRVLVGCEFESARSDPS